MQIIKYEELWLRLLPLLSPTKPGRVDLDDSLSENLPSGTTGVMEFLKKLNSDRDFRNDGLSLVPSDVSVSPSLRDIMTAIISDYRREGWKVIF